VTDQKRFTSPKYDITDIIAQEDKFAIRFVFTAKGGASGQPVSAEANYFYHLRDGKVSEFWLLADIDFDYRADS
jgi:predicted ester cyclase